MDIYVAIYLERYPAQMNDIFTYSQHIKRMMADGADWQMYDRLYRTDREYTACSWLTVRQDLELRANHSQFLRNRQQPFRHNNLAASTENNTPVGYCFMYHNRHRSCNNDRCPYKHTCPRCNGPHPSFMGCARSNYARSHKPDSRNNRYDSRFNRQDLRIIQQHPVLQPTQQWAQQQARSR